MKKYLVDTNVFLRFFLKDSRQHFQKAKNLFSKASAGKIELETVPEVIFEIVYVLTKVYNLSKDDVCDILITILKSPYIVISNKGVLIDTVKKYRELNVDFVDIYLYFYSKENSCEVFSFDRDFLKLE